MDAISHALIGLTVAGLSGQPLSLNDPVYMATLLGSQAPDFDIIAQMRGSFSYIKQHRASSHSLLGLGIWALLIASGIELFTSQAHFAISFLWAFAGGLSHIVADYLNTHGTALFWPYIKERKSCKLLNVFDPILLILMLGILLLNLPPLTHSFISLLTCGFYIITRLYLRYRAKTWLHQQFGEQQISNVAVMPSLKRILFWDFVIETTDSFIVGKIGALYPVIEVKTSLPKNQQLSYATAEAQKTLLGDFFTNFSPLIYFEENYDEHFLSVNIYDLRYFINQQFRHSATIIFNKDYIPVDSYMLSYGRKIKIPC